MYDRILVPTDGSTGTAHVALQAFDLAERYGATVYALHVIDTDLNSLLGEATAGSERLQSQAEKAVNVIDRMGEAHDVPVVTEIREGDPADTILVYAEETGADLIVSGTHGRSGIRRHLLGSVAERLVRHATCPVMTVSLPDTDVTVEDEETARGMIEDALEERGLDATVESVGRELSVWVGEATTEEGHAVVYLDPETQRTSVLARGG